MRIAITALLVPYLALRIFTAAACADLTFHPTAEAARKAADGRPIVLYFTASWCGWCRRMEADVFPSPAMKDLLAKYEWVKVDIEAQPDLAARYRVRGVPVFVILDSRDDVVASRAGFLSVEKLTRFLTTSGSRSEVTASVEDEKPLPGGNELIASLKEGNEEMVARAVAKLSRADRAGRRDVLAAFAAAGKPTWGPLWTQLQSDRLAMRAAAAAALEHSTSAGIGFHSFAAPEKRAAQQLAWSEWLLVRGIEVSPRPAEAEIPVP